MKNGFENFLENKYKGTDKNTKEVATDMYEWISQNKFLIITESELKEMIIVEVKKMLDEAQLFKDSLVKEKPLIETSVSHKLELNLKNMGDKENEL